jgi:hypothetical protein
MQQKIKLADELLCIINSLLKTAVLNKYQVVYPT